MLVNCVTAGESCVQRRDRYGSLWCRRQCFSQPCIVCTTAQRITAIRYAAPQEVLRMNVLRPQTVFFFRAQVSGRRPLVCFLVWCHRREHRCSGPRSLTAALKIRERRLARVFAMCCFRHRIQTYSKVASVSGQIRIYSPRSQLGESFSCLIQERLGLDLDKDMGRRIFTANGGSDSDTILEKFWAAQFRILFGGLQF